MQNRDKILIVGCGDLSGILLEYLCRVPNVGPIVVADINAEAARLKVNSCLHGASFLGLYPDITARGVDVMNHEQTAALISEVNPCIVFNGTTLQSWWVVNELPKDINAKIYRHKAGLGSWVPMHLALASRLMAALKDSGVDAHYINTSFPDTVNVSLARVGMPPTIGIGNGALILPYFQKAAAEKLGIPRGSVRIEWIGHHYHSYTWPRQGIGADVPHYLRLYYENTDITDDVIGGDMQSFVASLPKIGARPGGRGSQYLVAASCMKNILDIYFDTNALGMSPGPLGLEGGYPVRLSRKGAELVLPKGMTVEQARALMVAAQEYDGTKSIEANGDIVVTDEVAAMYKEELGISWTRVTIKDSYDQAMELRKKFLEFLDRHGIPVPK